MRYPIKITDNFLLEPIMHTFGCRPETSFAEIKDGSLEVSMGIWFHEVVPLSEIARIAPSEWPWWGGLGVKLYHHGIGVVASLDGVANVRFKSPIKMRAVVQVECSQLWISLEDREGFLRALSERCSLPISEHTKF